MAVNPIRWFVGDLNWTVSWWAEHFHGLNCACWYCKAKPRSRTLRKVLLSPPVCCEGCGARVTGSYCGPCGAKLVDNHWYDFLRTLIYVICYIGGTVMIVVAIEAIT